jgi:hypothetical protein
MTRGREGGHKVKAGTQDCQSIVLHGVLDSFWSQAEEAEGMQKDEDISETTATLRSRWG